VVYFLFIDSGDIGNILKQLRLRVDISRVQLSSASGVSISHLTRIENGQRFPSAKVLRKIAPHLHISEVELLSRAGYLPADQNNIPGNPGSTKLDPDVVALLSQEPVEVQRAVVGILSVIKYIAEGIAFEQARARNDNPHEPVAN
jgi:transcriptional regulator with XRE-family HTH domain